ncbi:hypothetical protein [Streptomyces hygroscopicus]|uniref:hypothetical protein n=1 Tax=Streptomyces hygroscopicus TaxID=1912 RepID=UPI002240D010|nr:hypothetical protein [Streptomyces hygroscopicus]
MDTLIASLLGGAVVVMIVAVAAVLVARFAMNGTDSGDRAAVLQGVATVIRAIRGKR